MENNGIVCPLSIMSKHHVDVVYMGLFWHYHLLGKPELSTIPTFQRLSLEYFIPIHNR